MVHLGKSEIQNLFAITCYAVNSSKETNSQSEMEPGREVSTFTMLVNFLTVQVQNFNIRNPQTPAKVDFLVCVKLKNHRF